ncbi:ras and EF-hand domain-containing protein homolog isoform X2 [Anneissia japonica]|uniref:ras and EF-hand domain-containing protein homolog isoform X2 n=1 Tax=Anneissia japonica TaxID=1529436 RepID=UPI0014257AF4|nr:ras and EF-hand domain-containing protein homolog isoform X2 [Anneissia japonica]
MADLHTNTTMMKELPTPDEMKAMIVDKSRELFLICDTENKGFITKRDMQRLGSELPLSPEQLEAVFDSLDDDGNGFLTLEEFTDGFGGYLGLPQETVEEEQVDGLFEANENKEYNLDEDFKRAMETIDASEVLQSIGGEYSHELAREIWIHLKQDNQPDLLNRFEDFMQKISMDVRRVQHDTDELENAMKSRSVVHDQEVKKLYEEMEHQLKTEKERIAAEEQDKGRKVVNDLSQQLEQKDDEMRELLIQKKKLEEKMEYLSLSESIMKEENQHLQKEKDVLRSQLDDTQANLQEQKLYLKEVKNTIRRDKKERAMHTLRMTQGINNERDSLVYQLDMLRDVNKKLLDERDAFEAESRVSQDPQVTTENKINLIERAPSLEEELMEASRKNRPKKKMVKQGSILANYFNDSPTNTRAKRKKIGGTKRRGELGGSEEQLSEGEEDGEEDEEDRNEEKITDNDSDDSIEVDENYFTQTAILARTQQPGSSDFNANLSVLTSDPFRNVENAEITCMTSTPLHSANGHISCKDLHMHSPNSNKNQIHKSFENGVEDRNGSVRSLSSSPNEKKLGHENQQSSSHSKGIRRLPSLPVSENSAFSDPKTTRPRLPTGRSQEAERVEPVGCQAKVDMETELLEVGVDAMIPERVFKVVFIGDSGVGKTTFLHRFTTDSFKNSFSATIGVDFRIKAVKVENKIVALQLWDTAGQERFRSITKQYFRKADGIVVMYDVNCEGSFLSVRNWMNSIEENAEDGVVKMMIGNKTDLVQKQELKPVKDDVARKFAETYNCSFMETSAKSGDNVLRAMYIMARYLLDKEDKEIEKSLNLVDESIDSKGCCPL